MASPEAAIDPLTEYDNLTIELAHLEKQFADRKVQEKDFQSLSNQLKERIQRAESHAYNSARKDDSIAQRLRLRNFYNPTIQQVISHFMKAGGNPLEPFFGPDRIPRYPIKTETGEIVNIERSLLQKMADIGMVSEALYERSVSCPSCGTPTNVYLRFKCAQCSSIDITINRMIEHLQCGTIHQESVFRVGRNLICPTCKKLLQSTTDYRVIGVVCSCKACSAHFEDPIQSFYCRACKKDFSLPSASVVDVFAYSMRTNVLNEARRFLGVDALSRILTENGFLVKSPGIVVVVGERTKEAVFALTAQKDTRLIAVDVSQSDTEVEVEPVLELFVKMLQAKPTLSIFGAIPVLSKRARDVATMHNILVAEGPNPNELAKKVLEIIGHG